MRLISLARRLGAAHWPRLLLILLMAAASSILVAPTAILQVREPASGPPVVFELELPELGFSPTSSAELTIPSPNVTQVFVHILRPVADNVDYSAIRTFVNGNAAATISEIGAGVRGKLIRIDLKRLPGFAFVSGRNTVEVWAQNRRGRTYYASFVISTATENRNEDFSYHVEHAANARWHVPPDLQLLEPRRAIDFPTGQKSLQVKISGAATAATAIKRVSVDGHNVALKARAPGPTNGPGLTNEDRRVEFETSITINANSDHIMVEAEDDTGTRTQLSVPVGKPERAVRFSGRKYALIVGISKYKEGIQDLRYADADALSLAQFLQQPDGGNFSSKDILLLRNEEATLANIRQALTTFISKPAEDDLLLIFFAGHGDKDPSPLAAQDLYYIIASDTNIDSVPETALPMTDLSRYVDRNVRAKRVVLLVDTCHSAGLSTTGTRSLATNLVNLRLRTLLYQEEGRAIMTSSDVKEYSHEDQRWGGGHGVFTFFLLEGLKGRADTNADQLVTVGELFRFVRDNVQQDAPDQHPKMFPGANENLELSVARPQK